MRSGETEAIVIIKAAPQVGQRHGETVCCAGIDLQGHWLRLYPISFRTLDQGQKFGRWDRVRFRWRIPNNDHRIESRHVDQDSLEIVGTLRKAERERFLAKSIVTSLDKERKEGKSLALLKAEILGFRAKEYRQGHALSEVTRVFGKEYPSEGMLLAMGTHSQYPDTWLINGVVRLDDVKQSTLF